MSEYIGRRIIPVHGGVWNGSKSYEELTIVLHEDSGDSYISRRAVPAGTAITDENYWMLHSLYSQQIADAVAQSESLSKQVSNLSNTVEENVELLNTRLDNLVANAGDASDNAELIDIRVGADGTQYSTASESIQAQDAIIETRADYHSRLMGLDLATDNYISVFSDKNKSSDTTGSLTEGYEIPAGSYVFPWASLSSLPEDICIAFQCDVDMDFECEFSDNATTLTGNSTKMSMQKVGDFHILKVSQADKTDAQEYLKIRIDNRNGESTINISNLLVFSGYYFPLEIPEENPIRLFLSDRGEPVFQFNTEDKTLSIVGILRVFSGSAHYSISPDTISYDIDDATVFRCLLVDLDTRTYSLISKGEVTSSQRILMTFFCSDTLLKQPNCISYKGQYMVDDVLYPRWTDTEEQAETVYVATTGSDDNDGSKASPFATIQKGIDSQAKCIMVAPGIYRENVSSTKVREELQIVGQWTTFSSSLTDQPFAIIDAGEEIELSEDTGSSLLCAEYDAEETDLIYKVFISKTLDVEETSSTRSTGYNVTLWELGDDVSEDRKLAPVLTLKECQETEGSWHYSGAVIYVNTGETGKTYKLTSGITGSGLILKNIGKLRLEGLAVRFSNSSNAILQYCRDVVIRDCEFDHSAIGEGISMNYCNGTLYSCKAYQNRNDGFNMHGDGDTHFVDCQGFYNYDDGLSHHDGCTGSVNGGEYHHNGKGGVASPTHGAKVDVYNVVVHDNPYGIYAGADSSRTPRDSIISGCAIFDNTVGILASRYTLYCFNNKVHGNGTDTQEGSGGQIVNLDE